MNLLSFSERLDYALKQAGKKPVDLARHIDVSRAAISQLLSGSSKSMKPEHLVSTARFLGVRVEWLASGEDPIHPRRLSAKQRVLLDYTDHLSSDALDAAILLIKEASGAFHAPSKSS